MTDIQTIIIVTIVVIAIYFGMFYIADCMDDSATQIYYKKRILEDMGAQFVTDLTYLYNGNSFACPLCGGELREVDLDKVMCVNHKDGLNYRLVGSRTCSYVKTKTKDMA